ncbi:hypothetical protein BKA70DRAFT_1426553 [Coprinopsis sp. MPI-PUGE-AT-0042]|nr:hypothetical protein BKA70DRAFT_1426553 [Coprinopsis sp. MPI-PUGE-AT-0042]
MNRHYDTDEAKRFLNLEQEAAAKGQSIQGMLMCNIDFEETAVRRQRYPSSYRLAVKSEEETTPQIVLM